MPPKKHEIQIVVEIPEQPPTVENNAALIDRLLSIVLTHPNDAAATVASAINMDDFLINLQHGIVVDLWVETLILCAQQKLKANKTIAVLELVDAMRASIVESQSCSEAKVLLRAFFVRHVGLAVKEKELIAANIVMGTDGQPALGDGGLLLSDGKGGAHVGGASASLMMTGVGPSVGPSEAVSVSGSGSGGAAVGNVGKGKAGSTKKGKGVEEPPPPQRPSFDAGLMFLDTEDMKVVAPYIAKGLIQHWRLYAMVGAFQRTDLFVPAPTAECERPLEPLTFSFSVGVQTPMASHSLATAMSLEDHVKYHADEAARASAQRVELQAREEAMIASERASLEAAIARRKAEEDEERAGLLYLKKVTAAKAVEQLSSNIEGELSERQRRIIMRLQKLEDALQLATSSM